MAMIVDNDNDDNPLGRICNQTALNISIFNAKGNIVKKHQLLRFLGTEVDGIH